MSGALIVNADDWGRDRQTTDQTLACVRRGTVSAVSAMMFMEDSERAAAIARDSGIDAGLHLNLTTAFSARRCSARLIEHHDRITGYLRRCAFTRVIFNPRLIRSFEYVVGAQVDEFRRIFRTEVMRVDGHHHMHLCANVLKGGLLPRGTIVRRNFSFGACEKSVWNRAFRNIEDSWLARRYRIADFFFSLPPMAPRRRLKRIFGLAAQFKVEVETHPIAADEYDFLMGEEMAHLTANTVICSSVAALSGR